MTSVQRLNNFIDGKFVTTDSYIESRNPATDEINSFIPDSTPEDADIAVKAARNAFPG